MARFQFNKLYAQHYVRLDWGTERALARFVLCLLPFRHSVRAAVIVVYVHVCTLQAYTRNITRIYIPGRSIRSVVCRGEREATSVPPQTVTVYRVEMVLDWLYSLKNVDL